MSWGLLLPLGTLLPRHRWVLRGKKLLGKDAWFSLHMACQLSGLLVFAIGFIIAVAKLQSKDTGMAGAHKALGIAVAAMASLQFVAAFIRPHPGTPR